MAIKGLKYNEYKKKIQQAKMVSNYCKQIMIKQLFTMGYDPNKFMGSTKIATDFFGKYFYFEYPGADTRYYYFKQNIVLNRWEHYLDFLSISNIDYDENYPNSSLIKYNDEYYIIDSDNYGEDRFGNVVLTIGDIKYKFKTESRFKWLLKELEAKKYEKK